jgi:hypothetical protein
MRALLPLLAVLFADLGTVTARAQEAVPAEARVTYLTSSTAYLDAGSESGLRKSSIVTVIRDGVTVATLEVVALSTRRASCARPPGVELRVGDRVTFVPVSRSGKTPTPAPAPSAPLSTSVERKLRGRVGIRYLGFDDRTGTGESYVQPGLDVRLEGTSIVEGVDVSADVRARRTWRTLTDGSELQNSGTRVYALLARWRPASGLALTAGRQVAASLASVSIFDGVAASLEGASWSVGGFGGTQPGIDDFGWSDRIREWGAWIGWRDPARAARTAVTTGFVSSRDGRALDREYFVVEGRMSRDRLFAQLTQEIDLNRGWKGETEPTLRATSTFLTGRWEVRPNVSLDVGFDGRRAVRLHRHRVTPETEFDDSVRRGAWGGVAWRPWPRTRVGASFRRSTGGDAGVAGSGTATLRTDLPRLGGASVGLRTTRYSNAQLDGWLHSATVGAPLGSRVHADLTLGVRDETDPRLPNGGNDLRWASLDLDVRLSPGWYALVSGERSDGDVERNTSVHGSIVYRF